MPRSRNRRTVTSPRTGYPRIKTRKLSRKWHRFLSRAVVKRKLAQMAPQLPPQTGKRREEFSRPIRVTGGGRVIGWGFA
jgi:hypothetical protein